MAKRIDLATAKKPVRDFLQSLGPIREPVELLVGDEVFARIVPPGGLSDAEKEEVVRKGWEVVQKARARNQGASTKEIEKSVQLAVKRVRARR